MTTSAQLPLCVYCGTERPADRSQCPQCGRPWIDVRVGTMAENREKVLVGAAITAEIPIVAGPVADDPAEPELFVDLTDEETSAEERSRVLLWAVPAVLAVSAIALLAMVAFGLLDDGPGDAAPIATTIPTTTAAPVTASTAPTTTEPPTTTVTTTTLPEPQSIVAAGDPVPVGRLTLHADGVGPIETGISAAEAVGLLTASLGTPEEIAAAGPEHGLCPDEDGRLVRWAGLTIIVSGTLDQGTFVGYRYTEPDVPVSHLDLSTPSGIRLGDAVATLNEVYADYSVSYEAIAAEATFSLSDGEQLLLWGPVSSTEGTGQVEGIFSAPSCPAP